MRRSAVPCASSLWGLAPFLDFTHQRVSSLTVDIPLPFAQRWRVHAPYSTLDTAPSPKSAPIPQIDSTVNAREASKFARLSSHWWDPSGPFRPLHHLNPVRTRFMRDVLCDHFKKDHKEAAPLTGLSILDVGCGGGLLSESLGRLGAQVDGIDVNDDGIRAAEAHAALDPAIAERVRYRTEGIESVIQRGLCYDAVVASEVIEHVESVPAFCRALTGTCAPGGAIIVSTMARTARAYALAVFAAENILQWVPQGTHAWEKFVDPDELVLAMEDAARELGAEVALEHLAGMSFDPVRGRWSLTRDTEINYIAFFTKSAHSDTTIVG